MSDEIQQDTPTKTTPESPEASGTALFPLPDASLQVMLARAIRSILIIGALIALALYFTRGRNDAALELTGALISAGSVWEWKRLIKLINARMDRQRLPANAPLVVFFFVFRLTIFAGVLYGSLKCFQGSVVALLFGLALAALVIGWEAMKLLRE